MENRIILLGHNIKLSVEPTDALIDKINQAILDGNDEGDGWEIEDNDISNTVSNRINQEIETLCDLLIEAPIEDFEDWFQNNQHLEKEISYSYGFIQAFVEMKVVTLTEKQQEIFELMAEYFDSI